MTLSGQSIATLLPLTGTGLSKVIPDVSGTGRKRPVVADCMPGDIYDNAIPLQRWHY